MSDIFKEYQLSAWDLSDLLPDTQESTIKARVEALEADITQFVRRRETLNAEMEPALLVETMQHGERILEQIYCLGAYGSLWFSADTQSPAALTYRNRMQQTLTQLQNRILFFELWWKSLDEDEAAALLPSQEQYPDYRFYLEDIRRTKPYTLDEKSEQIINVKDANGMDGLITLYSMLTSRLEFTIEVDGEQKTLTRDGLMGYVYSPKPELRAAAYQELYRVYEKEGPILAQIYANRVRDWYAEQVELRGYSSPIAVRNVANDIPDEAVDTLLSVARKNAPLF